MLESVPPESSEWVLVTAGNDRLRRAGGYFVRER